MPVSITHMPTGRGVDVAKPTTMLTEGPFARLARQSDAQEPQKPAPTSVAAQCQGEAPAAPTNGADNGAIQYSIDVQHLNFSYPGMGAWRALHGRVQPCLLLATQSRRVRHRRYGRRECQTASSKNPH